MERLRKIVDMTESAGSSNPDAVAVSAKIRQNSPPSRVESYFACWQFGAGMAEESYDFTDGAALGGGDCEYLDGRHGGDVVYMRLLQKVLEQTLEFARAAYSTDASLAGH